MKGDIIMKKTIKLIALALVLSLSVVMLASCLPPNSNPEKAIESLKENDYKAVEDDTVLPLVFAGLGIKDVDTVVTGTAVVDEKVEHVTIVYFENADAAKAAWEDVKEYAEDKDKKEEKEKTAPLVKGSIDMWFLLWTLLLLCFGVVMSYSASAFYAQDMYDSSMHFFWRYILFTLIAALIAVFFVIYARPWFWKAFGIAAYAGSVVLLVIVRIAGHEGGGAER